MAIASANILSSVRLIAWGNWFTVPQLQFAHNTPSIPREAVPHAIVRGGHIPYRQPIASKVVGILSSWFVAGRPGIYLHPPSHLSTMPLVDHTITQPHSISRPERNGNPSSAKHLGMQNPRFDTFRAAPFAASSISIGSIVAYWLVLAA